MDVKKETAGSCLDILISSFNARIVELQELVIARNSNFAIFFLLIILSFNYNLHVSHSHYLVPVYPATAITDLSAVDTSVKTLEYQMQSIKDRLRQEAEAIPKARVFLSLSLSVRVSDHLHLCL